jgi:hypothetical protein
MGGYYPGVSNYTDLVEAARARPVQDLRNTITGPVRRGQVPQRSPLGRGLTNLGDQAGVAAELPGQVLSQGANIQERIADAALNWLTQDPGQADPAAIGLAAGSPEAGVVHPDDPGTRGLSPQQFRQQHGMPPTNLSAAAADTHGIGPEDLEFERRSQHEGDLRARESLKARAFAPSFDPWHPSGGGLSMNDIASDLQAHALLDARSRQAKEAIDASEVGRDPMDAKLAAEQKNAAYEEIMPGQRPLFDNLETGEQGAFDVESGRPGHQSVYTTGARPAMRLGAERSLRVAANQQAIAQGLSQTAETLRDKVANGEMTRQQAQDEYRNAERLAAMQMQGQAGGKDFSGFFKDPEGLAMAGMLAGSGAPGR